MSILMSDGNGELLYFSDGKLNFFLYLAELDDILIKKSCFRDCDKHFVDELANAGYLERDKGTYDLTDKYWTKLDEIKGRIAKLDEEAREISDSIYVLPHGEEQCNNNI